jgi:nitrite reductase/ring-hydroxylating ferredoxin subunit
VTEQIVGKSSDLKEGERRVFFVGGGEIGVFRHGGELLAYSNYCLHQGGPACEGMTIARVEERLNPDKTSAGLFFSETEMNFVCPWHGYEYDMKTGECISDRRLKLRRYQVLERDGDIYVID